MVKLSTLAIILLQNPAKVKSKIALLCKNNLNEVNEMDIGNRIKEIRTLKSLSYDDFAIIGGVSVRSQRMYEGNKTPPSAEYCKAIAEKFTDIDMNWLLTGEGEMLKNESQKTPFPNVINGDILCNAIKMTEEILEETGRTMKPESKAKAVSAIYDLLKNKKTDKQPLLQLIRAVA